jgi:hypothetical protein
MLNRVREHIISKINKQREDNSEFNKCRDDRKAYHRRRLTIDTNQKK